MFKLSSRTKDEIHESLIQDVKDFIELKYVVDKNEEIRVVSKTLNDLLEYGHVVHVGDYANTYFRNAYGCGPLEVVTGGLSYTDIRDSIETVGASFEAGSRVEMELLRLVVMYAKSKDYNVEALINGEDPTPAPVVEEAVVATEEVVVEKPKAKRTRKKKVAE